MCFIACFDKPLASVQAGTFRNVQSQVMADTSSPTVWRRRFDRLVRGALHLHARFARGMTLGVRAVVLDDDGRVLLVRHTYVSGWYLPGGGVETGETVIEALRRELFEEANVALDEPPRLHGIFLNRRISRRDHVAVYLVRNFRRNGAPKLSREIAECAFFATDNLPAATTPGTRARIREVIEGAVPSGDLW
jgi:ADP-ribose pyrophosphatase YjhB (NUDIX family)